MIISIFIFFLSKSEYLKYYCSDFYKTYTLRCVFLLSIQCTLIYFIISSGLEINSNKPFCLQNDGEIHLKLFLKVTTVDFFATILRRVYRNSICEIFYNDS